MHFLQVIYVVGSHFPMIFQELSTVVSHFVYALIGVTVFTASFNTFDQTKMAQFRKITSQYA